ncbi:hypothetical protein [Candidatus Magnetominusculus xianensis]|uniref:hypothetical protein n=1 Tax=Candidatus Magnetominusculus xianensis TaxID=1748249 RepID=UPI000A113BE8|nr:hypothetical protein [Candidatus Magnetominusculus xianensis]MBF0404772.1 hypothetical protein [Nitrospirota bacterium]
MNCTKASLGKADTRLDSYFGGLIAIFIATVTIAVAITMWDRHSMLEKLEDKVKEVTKLTEGKVREVTELANDIDKRAQNIEKNAQNIEKYKNDVVNLRDDLRNNIEIYKQQISDIEKNVKELGRGSSDLVHDTQS